VESLIDFTFNKIFVLRGQEAVNEWHHSGRSRRTNNLLLVFRIMHKSTFQWKGQY